MRLDLPTLMTAGAFIAAVSAVLILFAWANQRDGRGLPLWAAGSGMVGVGLTLLLAGFTSHLEALIVAGSVAMNVAAFLYYISAQVLNRQAVAKSAIAAASVLQVAALALPPLLEAASLGMVLSLVIFAGFCFAAAYDFWRGRDEPLRARWFLIGFLLLQGLVDAVGAVEAALDQISFGEPPPLGSWFGLTHFVTIVFLLGTAIFVVAFARERAELLQKTAASIDALTGALNRRAILDAARGTLDRLQADDPPLSLVVFDLDRFKSINDTFGHSMGDQVLGVFVATVRDQLRADDRVGRLGGEEFAVLLPATSLAAAVAIAERIRANFVVTGRACAGVSVNATVSGGVAAGQAGATVEMLLRTADEGLYRAKGLGRNRIERGEANKPPNGVIHLGHVA